MTNINQSNASPSGSADNKLENLKGFFRKIDGYIKVTILSLVIPAILSFSLASNWSDTFLFFFSWLAFMGTLYLFLANILGENATTSRTWFTGLGENQIKFIVNQSNQLVDILTPGRYEVTEKEEVVKVLKDGKEEEVKLDQGMLINRKKGVTKKRTTWFGGLYPVLIPPFRRVFDYQWSWQKIVDITTKDPKAHSNESVDALWIIQQQFIEIAGIETKGLETFKVKIQPTIRIIYPKKTMFKNDRPGNWLVRLTTEIINETYKFFSDVEGYNKVIDMMNDPEGKKTYIQNLIELNGITEHKTPEGDDFVSIKEPGKGIVAIIGVMLLDVAIVDIESEEVGEMREAQKAKRLEELKLEKEGVAQEVANVKQDAENKRIESKAEAEANAERKKLNAKAEGLKSIVEAGGEKILISENLKNLQVLGENPSVVMNLSEQKTEKKDDEEKGGKK